MMRHATDAGQRSQNDHLPEVLTKVEGPIQRARYFVVGLPPDTMTGESHAGVPP